MLIPPVHPTFLARPMRWAAVSHLQGPAGERLGLHATGEAGRRAVDNVDSEPREPFVRHDYGWWPSTRRKAYETGFGMPAGPIKPPPAPTTTARGWQSGTARR